MKKRGIRAQSQIITTILLIILVLAAIIIVWAVVNNLITESVEGIGTSALTTSLEIKDVKIYIAGDAKIKIKRGAGEGNITSLKFIFYSEDGESVIIEETKKIPKEIETKIYDFGYSEIKVNEKIEKVSVVPMFGSMSGREFSAVKSKIKEPNGEGVYYANLIPNWEMETDDDWTDPPEQVFIPDMNGINHYAHRSDETDSGCYNWAKPILIPADANKAYKFSIWIKSNDLTMHNYLGFYIYDSSKTRIVGDWNNPYFKTSDIDLNEWKKWEGYLGPSYAGGATNCDSSETNGNDWCMADNTAFIMMRFGSCYGDGGSNGHTWFMYPKIEEVEW